LLLVPLPTDTGGRRSGVGSLCVIDNEPRSLTTDELAALHVLAHQTERLLAERLRAREHAALLVTNQALEQRYAAVTESMPCGVVVHARDGSIESANEAAEAVLGLTLDQMQGRTPMHEQWQCVHPDGSPFPGEEHPASVTLRDRTRVRDVVMGVSRADGDRRWILVNASPLSGPDDKPAGAVATFVDITREVDLQERLQHTLETLEHSTHERAALVAAITHDLAAPVAATRILADLLPNVPDGPKRADAIEALRSSAHRVEERIVDLAAMTTKMRQGQAPDRTTNDVRTLVIRGCADAGRFIDTVMPPHPVLAEVDALQIERIVDNLVSNACKHAPPDARITVTLSVPGDVVIVVDDDGPEIPATLRDTVFEPFRRLSTSSDGDGVGLYLVRQFARFHDGTATCEARPGGGNRFTVTIAATAAARG
jgi:PAS domain S-box-containing protein